MAQPRTSPVREKIDREAAEKLVPELLRNGYLMASILPDGSVAGMQRMLTTVGLFLGVTPWGFESRFCFRDPGLALARFALLQSEDDIPAGWLARRPEHPEDVRAKGMPGYLGGDPALPSSWEAGS